MDRPKIIDDLVRDEGLRLKPYKDSVGKTTIGIGRNLDDVGINKEEAFALCNNDLDDVEGDLDFNLPWWRNMNEVRQRALGNMCFNLGIVRLLKFSNMLRFLKEGSYNLAAVEMRASKWYDQVGIRATRLEQMVRTGEENDPSMA